jgi:GNAT superfamily N-acetyltransferase
MILPSVVVDFATEWGRPVLDALHAADAAAAAALSAAFGWPHREADWDLFLRLGQGVAWRDDGGLGGTAMWFSLDAGHASIGLVQVSPALQGRGIGRRLMRAVMDAAAPRGLLLHATAAGAGLYAALGFAAAGTVQQWQGEWARPAAVAAHPAGLETIAPLDHAATGLQRRALLDALLPHAVVASEAGGYAMCRRFGRGDLVGPVVAPDEAAAIRLVAPLATPGFLRLDVPAAARELTRWLAAGGLACAGEVVAMTTGAWPIPPGPAKGWALASQALG